MSQRGQFALLGTRRFLPFFTTQALGAFNDNVFKNALVIMLTFKIAGLSQADINTLANLAAGLFILPFFLFSASAGQWAEKYERARSIRRIKLLEIGLMLLAALGFWLQSLPFLLGVLFLMGAQSTLFGPIKYSILPEHLRAAVPGGSLTIAGILAEYAAQGFPGPLHCEYEHNWETSVPEITQCLEFVKNWKPAAK